MEHNQVPVQFEDETIFTVDEKLQSLIQYFFDNGFETFNSCQDNVRGTTWIEYALEDWILIAEIAFLSETREVYEFIEEHCQVLLLSCDDGEPDENDEYWIEGENLIWSASVRFPKEHLKFFEYQIRNTIYKPDSVH